MDAVFYHHIARRFVERRHQPRREHPALLRAEFRLGSRRENADTERLGQKQHVSRLRAGIGQHAVGMHKACHREPVFRLIVQNGVPARDECTSLIDLVIAAAQQRVDRVLRHIRRNCHDVQTELRLAAHRIDIRKRVGRRDLPEGIGVVRNRREEIHRLHQRQLAGDLVNRGVIAAVEADQQIRVLMYADALEQLRQHARAHLRAAASAFCKLCQPDRILFHVVHTPNRFPPRQVFSTPEYSKIACKTPPPMAIALSEAV